MTNPTKTSSKRDNNHSGIVSEAQIAGGNILLVDPSGKEYPITDYSQELSPERERAILDKIVLLKMAASLQSADVGAIICQFITVLQDLANTKATDLTIDTYIDTLATELAFHTFIRDVAEEKKNEKIMDKIEEDMNY